MHEVLERGTRDAPRCVQKQQEWRDDRNANEVGGRKLEDGRSSLGARQNAGDNEQSSISKGYQYRADDGRCFEQLHVAEGMQSWIETPLRIGECRESDGVTAADDDWCKDLRCKRKVMAADN